MLRLIATHNIDVLSVSSRAKLVESAVEKLARKGYAQPHIDITDLAAVRVITFIESDVHRVAQIVEEAFRVAPERSIDKSRALGVDRAGYRSLHFVCTLGAARARLPEFAMFADVAFEVQVRTVIQHAWAEVEHNRRYKFAGVLPEPLQRRLFLLAGMLEIADRELATIAADVDQYATTVATSARAGDLNIEINSTSLLAFVDEKLQSLPHLRIEDYDEAIPAILIDELRDFGATSLVDVDRLFSPELMEALRKHETESSHMGIVRSAMLLENMQRYFDDAWKNHWQGTDDAMVAILSEKYDEKYVREVFARYRIGIGDDTDDELWDEE